MITEKNSTFKKALFAYKIYNLIYLLLAFNAFVNGMTFMKYATMLSAAFGAVLGVWMLKDYKEYLKVPNLWILLAFIISAVISAVVNIKYGFVENIEGLVWMAILLIVIYVPTCNFSREEILKELKVISWITVVYCTAAHVFSLSMIFWGRNMEYKDPQGVGHIVGFNWGRLWGIYDEPNRGSVIGLFAFFLAVYLIWECKKKSTKIFLVLTMVIQYLFLVFSDSRTGQLALAAALFVLAGIGSYNRMHGKGKKKIILAILLACGVAVSSLVLTMGCKAVFNTVDAKIVSMMPAKNEKPKKATKIGRKKIWKKM